MTERRVLVTGSSRGIGRAIALRLAREGWSVAVHYGSDSEAAEKTLEELGNRAAGIYKADLESPSNLIDMAIADGPLHALVNNAGIYLPSSFAAATDDEFDSVLRRTMAVNFESPARLIRGALKAFGTSGGKILNVASRVGFKSEAGAALYAASKAALINLTRSLAVELAANNVQIFGIAPGWVDTAMARDRMNDRLAAILESIPLGRMATPEDCAAAAAFLLSDDAGYLSGQVIDINGASYFH